MKVTLIIGLPGSGKTYLGRQYENFIDDPRTLELNGLENVAIADPQLCVSTTREKAIEFLEKQGYEVICIYFENNPEQCKKNVEYRNDGRDVASSIYILSKLYKIPDNITPIEVYNVQK